MKNDKTILYIAFFLIFINVVSFGVCLYYYSRPVEQPEREIGGAQELNLEATIGVRKVASATESITKRVQTGAKRIARAKKNIARARNNASEAIAIIDECESIIKEIETQE